MNQDNNNSQAVADRDTTTVAETSNTVRYAEPSWEARKHEKGVDVEVSLPGVRKDDLTLEVVGSQLRLEARRLPAADRGQLIHGEPAPEAYRLKLRLGETLDGEALEAHLADGVLRVKIPLVRSAQPRRIEIA